MKTKTKVVLFRVVGILFILTGLICLFLHWILAVIAFLFGVYHLTTTTKRVEKNDAKIKALKEKNKKGNETEYITTEQINELNRINYEKYLQEQATDKENNQKGIDYLQIEGKTLQALESLHIFNVSPSPDTVLSRYKFVKKLLMEYINYPSDGRFISAVQEGIDRYKTMYYDRTINADHFAFLLDAKSNLNEFETYFHKSLISSFERYLDKQDDQISQLKRQSAISNRFIKISEVLNLVENEVPDKLIETSQKRINLMKNKYLVNEVE